MNRYISENSDTDIEALQRQIRHSITRLLARREHSRVELLRKLSQTGFEPSMVSDGLALFIEKGWQSDVRYAEVFVRASYEKGKGPAYIEQRLQQHDIAGSTITNLLKDDAYDWYSAAIKVRSKRFGDTIPTNWDDLQKQKRFLQYRGFYQEHIKEVFS